MVVTKIPKPIIPLTPQQIAEQVAKGGLKSALEKAVEASSEEYRAKYKELLESKGLKRKDFSRFKSTEADVARFLDTVYDNLPSIFQKMVDDAVEEQSSFHNLTDEHKNDLRRELSNIIDQELRLKGRL